MVRFKTRLVQTDNVVDGSITNVKMDPTGGHFLDTKYKTASESVNNSITLQNDDHLVSGSLAINTEWVVEINLQYTCAVDASGDFELDFVLPAGASWRIGGFGMSTADALVNAKSDSGAASIEFGGSTTDRIWYFSGWILIGATAGTCQLRWAQNVAVAQNYTFLRGSSMILRRTV